MATLIGNGLCLRPLLPADAPALTEAALESLPTVGLWLPWCDAEFTLADAEEWVRICAADRADGKAHSLGIFDADDGAYLGGIGINHINREHDFANLGFWVRQSRQGAGIAPRAVRLMAAYGFKKLALTRLEIVAAEQNVRSRKVAERAGARFEGILHNRLVIRGVAIPAAMYALLPSRPR
ncbi:MAG TPA: GNAT family N-acetyltransferase [Duganella sp.]|jgi:RimJ/RimL family protein N-acetyltransferase